MSARIIFVVDDEPDVAELFRQRFHREARQDTHVMYFAASGEPWSSSKEHIVKPYMASLPRSPADAGNRCRSVFAFLFPPVSRASNSRVSKA